MHWMYDVCMYVCLYLLCYIYVGMEPNIGDEGVVEEPKEGMSFSSIEEVRAYYTRYAKQVGFGVTKRNSKTGADGQIRYFTLACVRQGTYVSKASNILKPRPMEHNGCKAKINAILGSEGKFRLTHVVLEHSHVLSPGKARYIRCHKRLDESSKRKLEYNDMAGIQLSKNYNSCVAEAGGYENLTFGERDARNYIREVRLLRLGLGGAEALQNYFTRMQAQNDGFYYIIDVDDETRLRNVFWADARSRAAYESFGDVITFDTTYLTNSYKMPFAPFVGVNHHGQSILFGCGLISGEDTDTFVWLFESWLKCMNGRAPQAIITDQDKAMQNAIARVFPKSRHRFCLWHIMKKVPEKFGAYSQYDDIKSQLHRCVYDTLSRDEFNKCWLQLLDNFDLHDHSWLEWLYSERHLWVPAYVRNEFWAGMSSTQRSEGMNAFFDDYVNSKTTLKQFVDQYDNALRRKIENELAADFSSFHTQIPCITFYGIERQFQASYTNAKFKEVQEELRGLIYCCASLIQSEGGIFIYHVADQVQVIDGFRKSTKYVVEFNEIECEANCTCQLFAFKGILCRHVIRVLTLHDKEELPAKYILDRWRKDLKRDYTLVRSSRDDLSYSPNAYRMNKLNKAFYEISSIAGTSDDGCAKLLTQLSKLKLEWVEVQPVCDNRSTESLGVTKRSDKLKSPVAARSKGRPVSKRKQSSAEKAINRLKARKTQRAPVS
ncbi:protein FAR1-RELATED SEQUENCE 5-like [Carya illinoinensis]|uniref:protein FAR1-RELATED SEQUENCE 5-like n=1 Tax=Carya illinoinensis TaxID=32201 RepID=UPI001C719CBA|nr:protein FAR1-RELATED SEQUENCE 5-like [Carya illinoinensis]